MPFTTVFFTFVLLARGFRRFFFQQKKKMEKIKIKEEEKIVKIAVDGLLIEI
jgi:hypothetical protein